MDLIKWQLNFGSCNFGLSYDFRLNCTPLSSITIINMRVENQHQIEKFFIGAIKKKKITQHNTADPTALIRCLRVTQRVVTG